MSDAHYDISGKVRGNVVQARDIYVDGRQPARSAYLHLVRDKIAPRALLDRDGELAELARFCTQPDGPSYVWWRANAWSGKSALLAWFVLNPPPGVRIVSFFVTARIPGQSDRDAFTRVVAEQLAELLGRPMPTEVVHWDATLLQLLDEAARAGDERLILLVDGLDEDRGVTTSPDSYSIAGLLPADPPHGMRVIVSGRPSPPVPSDVRGDHPLYDPAIVRPLAASEHAEAVEQDATRELKKLLTGTAGERDLLGLLTASGGGLTSDDLAELTESAPGDIQDQLRAVTARSFRPATTSRSDAYFFGHEQLVASATDFLGPTGIATYRTRLHDWAESYRERGWPADTPAYLLGGYHEMLKKTGDRDRLVGYALDTARHDRLRIATSGDTAALDELDAAQELLLAEDPPDLSLMTRIAVYRGVLFDNNDAVPAGVAVLWAELGETGRAESLASIRSDADITAETLADIAAAAALRGDQAAAGRIRQHTLALADRLTDAEVRGSICPTIAYAHTALGDLDAAEAEIRAFGGTSNKRKLVGVVKHLINTGDLDGAQRVATAMARREPRVHAMLAVAEAAIAEGEQDRADAIVEAVAADLDPITVDVITVPPPSDADLLAAVRLAVFRGDRRRAAGILNILEFLVTTKGDSYSPDARESAIEAAVLCGHLDRAEKLARSVSLGQLLLVTLAAESGDVERAERVARAIWDDVVQGFALAVVASAVEDVDRAEAIARSAPEGVGMTTALIEVARLALAAGDTARARTLVLQAQATPPLKHLHTRLRMLTTLISALVASGQVDQRLVSRFSWLAKAIPSSAEGTAFVRVAMEVGDFDTAESVIRLIDDSAVRDFQLTILASELAIAGEADRAVEIAHSLVEPGFVSSALAEIAKSLAATGDLDRADAVARSVDPARPAYAHNALCPVVTAAITAGAAERAMSLVQCLPRGQLTADLVAFVETAHRAGQPGIAQELVELARSQAERRPDDDDALHTAVHVAVADNQLDQAERLARRARHEWRRADLLMIVAVRAVHQGQLDRARTLFDEITPVRTVSAIHVAIALGDVEWAEIHARGIEDDLDRMNALVALAMAAADAGDFQRAEEIAAAMDDYHQATIMTVTIQKAIQAGAPEAAESLAGSSLSKFDEQSVLVDLADAFAAAGRLADAERVAASLPEAKRKVAAGRIATAAALAGDIERAVRLARTHTDDVGRIELLVDGARGNSNPVLLKEIERMARECTNQGNLARALALLATVAPQAAVPRLIAEVLAIGGWRHLIDVLEPAGHGDLLAEIAETYLELT